MAISSNGTIIRFSASSVSQQHRTSKGVKVMRLPEGVYVVGVTEIEKNDDLNEENKSEV